MQKYVACPRDCYNTCRLRIDFRGPKPASIRGDDNWLTKGVTCPRAARDLERVYSPLRILYPMMNIGKKGVSKKISWDEALDIIVSKLREVLTTSGPGNVLLIDYAGNRGLLTRHASRRLWNKLRAARTDYTICDAAGAAALRLVYGSTYGVYPEDLKDYKMIIIWGFNPIVSAIHMWRHIRGVRERGGLLVSIDVRRSETAKHSDLFIRVRPGSDGVLALGIARYLVDNNLVDKEFIGKHTYGFREFVKILSKYSLDYVEEKTGVTRRDIIELAELMTRYKPFAIFIGYGLQRRAGGGEIVRAVSVLPALLGIHRGFYYSNTDGLPIDFNTIEGQHLGSPSRIISMEKVGEHLAREEFSFVYVYLANPAATLPNSSRVIEGLKKTFLVVHETHWSDTAKIADIVLPAPTFMEKLDVVYSYWHNYLYLNRPVIEPLGEALGEYQLMCELAKRLGMRDYDKICPDPLDLLSRGLGPDTMKELLDNGMARLKPKPRNEYQTPTGKIELYSARALENNLPPLPSPLEEFIHEREFNLVSSAHSLYIHTQFEDVYGPVPGRVYISLDDARDLGIHDGDYVELYNDKGAIVLRSRISTDVPRGVLWVPRHAQGLNNVRISVLLDDGVESLGGGAIINSTQVRIRMIT